MLEVRCGQLLCLGPADPSALHRALEASDARATAAALLSRCLAEARPPLEHFEALLRSFFEGGKELFLLQCLAALPREARDLVGPLVAKGYWPQRCMERLGEVARQAPELTVAARWLGRRYGLQELAEPRGARKQPELRDFKGFFPRFFDGFEGSSF